MDEERKKEPPWRFILCRFLDPTECLGELLVGVVLALTITLGASLVVGKAPESTQKLLLAILGGNLAWGLIDGAIHLMSCMLERSRKARLIQSVRNAEGPAEALAIVAKEFDPKLGPFTTQEERARLYKTVLERLDADPGRTAKLVKEDLLGAASVSVWWCLCYSCPCTVSCAPRPLCGPAGFERSAISAPVPGGISPCPRHPWQPLGRQSWAARSRIRSGGGDNCSGGIVRAVKHLLICTGLLLGSLRAQVASQSPAEGEQSQKTPEWSYSVSSLIYLLPDDGDFTQPTFTADRNWVHLEARYNYEDLKTGSAWVGYNFTAGKRLTLEITPMVGAVFGATTGIAPGSTGRSIGGGLSSTARASMSSPRTIGRNPSITTGRKSRGRRWTG